MNRFRQPHIVLVGLMGTGKTTIGRQLAKCLEREFVDTDQVVESRTGKTVREIFATDGEPAFREIEAAVVADAVNDREPSVIAAAGGSVLRPSSRVAFARCELVVWLDASVDLLVRRTAARVGTGHRPLIDDDPRVRLTHLRDERQAVYDEVSTHRIDVDGRSVPEIVSSIVDMYSHLGPRGTT